MAAKARPTEPQIRADYWKRLTALDEVAGDWSDVRWEMQQQGYPEHDRLDELLGDLHLVRVRLRMMGYRITRRMAGKPEPPEMES